MGIKPKKYLGQHFLKNEQISKNIAKALDLDDFEHLVEVGPGMGALTVHLAKKTALTVIEKDQEAIDFFYKHIKPKFENIRMIEKDVLKVAFNRVFLGHPIGLVGNFPYNISSEIVFKVIQYRHVITVCCGMFQKEVAERINSPKGNKKYGILSVIVQAFYHTELLFEVSPKNFYPIPKVQSAVLMMKRKKKHILACNEKLFVEIIKTAFNQRRKKLRNSLKKYLVDDASKNQNNSIFDKRPEDLSFSTFVELTNLFEDV